MERLWCGSVGFRGVQILMTVVDSGCTCTHKVHTIKVVEALVRTCAIMDVVRGAVVVSSVQPRNSPQTCRTWM